MKRIGLMLLVLFLTSLIARGQSENYPTPKRILLLYHVGREAPGVTLFERGFEAVLRSAPPSTIELYREVLENYRFPGEDHKQMMHNYLKEKYAGRKIDVVVAHTDTALNFFLQYRDELFPGVPVVYVINKRPDPGKEPSLSTGVWTGPNIKDTLELALQLQPATTQVFLVSGSTDNRLVEVEMQEQLKQFEGRVRLNYISGRPVDEVIVSVKALPPDSVIIFQRLHQGIGGRGITPYDAVGLIAKAANVSVYSTIDTNVGEGIVGGKVVSQEDLGSRAARMAIKIAQGEKPEEIPVETSTTVPMFDWRQLKRWGISESRLPAGSIVLFKEQTFWQQYKRQVLLVLMVVVVQALLIAGLLIERGRKKRATRSLRLALEAIQESEERFAKAFKANPQPMSLTTVSEGRYLDVNESFLTVTGYARDEILNDTSMAIQMWETPQQRSEFAWALEEQGSIRNFEVTIRTKQGESRVLLSSAELLVLGGERCILIASSDITERKRAEEKLAELTGRLLSSQDEERRRIARELHDSTAQQIGVMLINLARIQEKSASLAMPVKEMVSDSLAMGEQALKDIRTLSYVLHPPLLEQAGLVTALRWYVKGFSERSGIKVDFVENENGNGRMPADVEYSLYRVVQECLTNISRHANTETASIKLSRSDSDVILEVKDRGTSLKPGNVTNFDNGESVGVGIQGMRHRLIQLGGGLIVAPGPEGFTVTATVPIRRVEND